NSQHAATASQPFSLLTSLGSRMKHGNAFMALREIEAGDLPACFRGSRISSRREHHTRRGIARPIDFKFTKSLFRNRFEDLGEVSLQSHQNRLSLRISETNIIFQNARTFGSQHQPDKKNTAEWEAFIARSLYCRLDYLADNSVSHCGVQHASICN